MPKNNSPWRVFVTQPAGGETPGAPAPTATPAPTAPGAPAAPPAPTGTPVPPASPPAPGLDPNAPIDFASLPPNVQKYLADLRQENGAHRQGKTAAEKQTANVLKALGLNPDGSTVTPEVAAAELNQRATAAEERAWGATVKLNIHERAAELGGNPKALLDSLSFVDSLDELADADPSSATFRSAMDAKITAALAANPNLRATGATPTGASGGDFTGGSGAGQPITEAQLANMPSDEIAKAYADGRLKHLL